MKLHIALLLASFIGVIVGMYVGFDNLFGRFLILYCSMMIGSLTRKTIEEL